MWRVEDVASKNSFIRVHKQCRIDRIEVIENAKGFPFDYIMQLERKL
jgi:hypothetical protein